MRIFLASLVTAKTLRHLQLTTYKNIFRKVRIRMKGTNVNSQGTIWNKTFSRRIIMGTCRVNATKRSMVHSGGADNKSVTGHKIMKTLSRVVVEAPTHIV